jgi:translation initiation factor IF-3
MNDQIRITPIRLIGAEGEQHGIVPTAQAQEMARDLGLDLVEVADKERPPVCKIMDYGKHKYAQSKKQATKTHQQKLKELRVRPKTGEHDVDTRVAHARKFLEHGDKVMIKVQFRGREMQHIEEGRRILDAMLEDLADCCKVETPPRMEGKQMMALLAPKGTGTGSAKPGSPKPAAPKPKPPADPPAAKPPSASPAAPPAAAPKPPAPPPAT